MNAWFDSREQKESVPEKNGIPTETPALSDSVQREIASHGTPKVRVLFMGTPEIAANILSGLIEEKYNIITVITKPDSPAGRDQNTKESAVKKVALEFGLPLEQPQTLNQETIDKIKNLNPDLIIVAAYGKILPNQILQIPGFGCINVHASLLPKWRGASPIQNALLHGDTETGISIMLMDVGMDTGSIIAQERLAIDPNETMDLLTQRLSDTGRALLLKTVPLWVKLKTVATPQDDSLATLCQLIEREDGRILWSDSAQNIYNRYRALYPWPGIFCFWKKNDSLIRLKLHRISCQKQAPQTPHKIGEVFEIGDAIGVETGEGIIFLEEIQLEGKTQLPIKEFLLGNKDIVGTLLQ